MKPKPCGVSDDNSGWLSIWGWDWVCGNFLACSRIDHRGDGEKMIGFLKAYVAQFALPASLIALLATGVYAGVQTWRLGNAQDKIDEQRQLIVDVKAANIVNQTTIETLRNANAEWSAKCRARIDIWASHIEVLEKEKTGLAEKLKAAPKVREVIYRESKDECAYIPVPANIAERLRSGSGTH